MLKLQFSYVIIVSIVFYKFYVLKVIKHSVSVKLDIEMVVIINLHKYYIYKSHLIK